MTKQTKNAWLVLFLVCFSFCITPAWGVSGVASDPSQTPYSARQLGIGGASIAFSDDANGIFTNPSGLQGFEFPQMSATSRKLMLESTQYTNLNWILPTNYGNFGIGYIGLGTLGSVPTIRDPATNRIIQDPSGEASSYSSSVTAFSYSRMVNFRNFNLAIGGNLKFYNQALNANRSIDNGAATAIDLSLTTKLNKWLTIGATLQNLLGGPLKWSSTEDKLGGYYKLGGAVNIWGSSHEALVEKKEKLVAGLDFDLPNSVLASSSSLLYHAGVEYFPIKDLALRAGLNQEVSGTDLTMGVGLTNGAFRFDYAYMQRAGIPGDNPNYFTLSYIGERTLKLLRKLKSKESLVKFLQPRDRLITEAESITLSVEAFASKVYDQKSVWTVTSLSETVEVINVAEAEALKPVYLNGTELSQNGTIETTLPLRLGRNVFSIVGYASVEALSGRITPELFGASGEVRVLRFSPFTDTPMNFWALEPIALCVNLDLVKGYPDNSFKPERGITRAELISLLVRTLPIKSDQLPENSPFSDVTDQHWAMKFIAYGSSQQLVSGYPGGLYKPNKVLTRAEGITILARYAGISEVAEAIPSFPDLKEGFWANKFIEPAKKAGLLKYLADKDFKPNDAFTRAEACEVLYQVPSIKRKVALFWETGALSGNQ